MPMQAMQGMQAPFDEYSIELEKLRQREALANALRMQSMQAPQPVESRSRIAPKLSGWQLASGLLNAGNAALGAHQVGQERKKLGEKYQTDLAQALKEGTPEALMRHPVTRPMAMQQMQARQLMGLVNQLYGRNPQEQPAAQYDVETGQFNSAPTPAQPQSMQGGASGGFDAFDPRLIGLAASGLPGASGVANLISQRDIANSKNAVDWAKLRQSEYEFNNLSAYQKAELAQKGITSAIDYARAKDAGINLTGVPQPQVPGAQPQPQPQGMPPMGQQGMPRASVDVTGMPPDVAMQAYQQTARGAGIQYPQQAPQAMGGTPSPIPQASTAGLSPQQSRELAAKQAAITPEAQQAAAKQVDMKFAPDYVEFTTGLGNDAVRQIANLRGVVKKLRDKVDTGRGANLTGPGIGLMPDAVKAIMSPEAADAQRQVEEIIQRGMRAILGAQFTEKEGERLISRSYNPYLGEKLNLVTLERLLTQMEKGYEQKMSAVDWFRNQGTLLGWKGQLPSLSDFAETSAQGAQPLGGGRLSRETLDWMRQNNIPLPPGY